MSQPLSPPAARSSKSRAMLHAPAPRPAKEVVSIPSWVSRAANDWASAYLPGYCLADLEKALAVVLRHPDHAKAGYSKAKTATQRLRLEINRKRALPAGML